MSTSTQIACVIIPVYQAEIAPHELIALDRCVSILKNHPIVIATPCRLDTQKLLERHPNVQREIFRDEFFDGIAGYNRMMLSDEFYERFAQFEFILIHQLDAFVFSDQLLHWCARNYDYVGAPWIPKAVMPNLVKKIYIIARRKLYRLINKRTGIAPSGDMMSRYQYFYSTGNGGFSLRRVAKMREMLTALSDIAELYRSGKCLPWAEDIFFSVEANRYWSRLRIPAMREAAHFSWELNPAAGSKLTDGTLPFGCHGWDKHYRNDWRPIFAQLGYSLDDLLAHTNS